MQNPKDDRIIELRKTDAGINQLLRENRALVWHFAKRYFCTWKLTKDEIFSAGMIGLWEAIVKYDPDRGSFSTIAGWRIRARVSREFARRKMDYQHEAFAMDALEENGIAKAEDLRTVEDTEFCKNALAKLNGRTREIVESRLAGKTLGQIADVFGLSRERIRQILFGAVSKIRLKG